MIDKNKLCKYILQLLIIFLVLKMLPETSAVDKIIISVIIVFIFYFFDNKTIEKLESISPDEIVQENVINTIKEDEKIKKITSELEELRKKEGTDTDDINKINNEKLSVLLDELGYHDHNHIPVDKDYKSEPFDYGYYYLPPEKWYPTPPFPPVCVTSQPCDVCPVFTTGSPVDVMQWHTSRRITPPDNISIDYIKEKLNAGK